MQLPDASSAAAAAAAAAELGPPTPDDPSPDPSDASSDDVSADAPWYLALRETAETGAVYVARGCCSSGQAAGTPPQQQQQQQREREQEEQQLEGLHTFSALFSSQCEHHLLPFYGRLKLAYLPADGGGGGAGGGGASRAALAHIVQMFSRRLQVQERLTHQVADAGAGWSGLAWAG